MTTNPEYRKGSPANSSGRASPANPRTRIKDDDGLNQKDKNVRRWTLAIEKVLSSFDQSVDEWADYVPFLVRLLKSLQSRPAGVESVPYKGLISKRLAQCLGPALPSGVHQKALEVYTCLFTIIENKGLSRDLALYLPGLSSLISYASLSVKPLVLTVYEDYIVNVEPNAIRLALKALILSLLPALEEEGSDEFERALQVLAKLKYAVKGAAKYGERDNSTEDRFFWQCFFLASITSNSRRTGALAYLSRHMPYLGSGMQEATSESKSVNSHSTSTETFIAVTLPEPGLLIRCFSSGLQDDQILVQRGFLDLLCERFPLSSEVFQEKAEPEDRIRLMTAAISVVVRRDMSLNRRLWTWILGPQSAKEGTDSLETPWQDLSQKVATDQSRLESDNVSQMQYYATYALPSIISSLKRQLTAPSDTAADRIKPLRTCIVLMDRLEIGHLVAPLIFTPVVSSVLEFQSQSKSKAARGEVVRSCNIFFDSMESTTIWTEVIRLLKGVFEGSDDLTRRKNADLLTFILSHFSHREDDTQQAHVPLSTLYAMLQIVILFRRTVESESLPLGLTLQSLRLVLSLLQITRNGDLASSDHEHVPIERLKREPLSYKIAIEAQYLQTENSASLSFKGLTGALILQSACEIVAATLKKRPPMQYEFIESSVMILDLAFKRISVFAPDISTIKTELQKLSMQRSEIKHSDVSITLLLAQTSILEILQSAKTASRTSELISDGFLRGIVPALAQHGWRLLEPKSSHHHVEASRALWRLSKVCDRTDYVESSIVSLTCQPFYGNAESQSGLNFCYSLFAFWQHSHNQIETTKTKRMQSKLSQLSWSASRLQLIVRPLFKVLDSLLDNDELSDTVENWLQSTSDLPVILHMVLIYTINMTEPLVQPDVFLSGIEIHPNPEEPDLESCIYAFEILNKLLYVARFRLLPLVHEIDSGDAQQQMTARLQTAMEACIGVATSPYLTKGPRQRQRMLLKQASFSLLEELFSLLPIEAIDHKGIDVTLLTEIEKSVTSKDRATQLILVGIIGNFLESRYRATDSRNRTKMALAEEDTHLDHEKVSYSQNRADFLSATSSRIIPSRLLHSLMAVFSTDRASPIVDAWVNLLQRILPMYGIAIFEILLPLNKCLCMTLSALLEDTKANFTDTTAKSLKASDNATVQLLGGLERSLELSHGLLSEMASGESDSKTGNQGTTFFGIVSSSSIGEVQEQQSTSTDRLTVLTCFQNALQVCFDFWALDETSLPGLSEDGTSSASFRYTIVRLRNRTRRITGHLFQAQDLECTEKLVSLWHDFMLRNDQLSCGKILGLVNTVDEARPKVIVPALFNAIYSRTNPTALELTRRSSLTTILSELTLAEFLVVYIRSIEDDTMDEIWWICIAFLKDVLANPLNHRQILVQLLQFIAELGMKVEKTNFGEQRKMRRELGDIFIKTFSAVLTIRPSGTIKDNLKHSTDRSDLLSSASARYVELMHHGSGDLVQAMAEILPHLSTLLERDRTISIVAQISAQMLAPVFRAKSFPENVDVSILSLLKAMGSIPEATKSYKKDVGEAFHDARFFNINIAFAPAWLPILRQWVIGDKDRIPELCLRLTAPAVAGIMFGVGASSARLEADRRTQLILRRVALLITAAPQDAFLVNLSMIESRLTEILGADQTSSPSSATRAEVYIVFRALLLKVSPNHLTFLWPILCSELSDALLAKISGGPQDYLGQESLLQLCKLIETLLILNLDDFQLRQWPFVTDTPDAVSRPSNIGSMALVDMVAEKFETEFGGSMSEKPDIFQSQASVGPYRRPLLSHRFCSSVCKEDYQELVFKPFFRRLSINAFEGVYDMEELDKQPCLDELVTDIFDETTLV